MNGTNVAQPEPDLAAYIDRLRRAGKIEKAALLDFSGRILIKCPGMGLHSDDTNGIIHALESPYCALTKLTVENQTFTCFRNSSTSLIGRDDHDVIIIYKCVQFIVVGISDPASPGSSIYEMTKFVKRCYRRSLSDRSSQCSDPGHIGDDSTTTPDNLV